MLAEEKLMVQTILRTIEIQAMILKWRDMANIFLQKNKM